MAKRRFINREKDGSVSVNLGVGARSIKEGFQAFGRARRITAAGGRVVVAEAESLERLVDETKNFRRLTDSKRDLPVWDHQRHQEVALHLFRTNHLARRILNMIADFVVGDGVIVTSKNEIILEAIDDFWTDPINAMDRENGNRVREFNLWGEMFLPVSVAKDGRIRIGWIDPGNVEAVVGDPVTGNPLGAVLTSEAADAAGVSQLIAVRWDDKEAGFTGDCFIRTMNTVKGANRGISELYTASDWVDSLEEVLFSQVDRARLLNSFVWDVKLEGMNQVDIDAWVEDYGSPPEPGSLRAHNEKVTWTAVSPQLGAYETSRMAKDTQDYLLGGLGIPSHWYGAGDSENLATAQQMAEPTRKMLKNKQKTFVFLLTDILSYMLYSRYRAGSLSGVSEDELSDFEVTIPDFSGPDIAKVGASVSQLVAAVEGAVEGGYISRGRGREVVAVIFSELGVEIDPSEEEEAIAEEQAEKTQKEEEGNLAAEENRQGALRQAAALAKAAAGRKEEEGTD